jgi:hypothetical protein
MPDPRRPVIVRAFGTVLVPIVLTIMSPWGKLRGSSGPACCPPDRKHPGPVLEHMF